MIRWSTLVADEKGVINYGRVRGFVSVGLATLAGIATVWVVFMARDVNETLVGIMVAACVAPLTGGQVADGLRGVRERAATAKVVAGEAPGRRASDPNVPAVVE